MVWTHDQLERIPEVYRDFLLALRPILDSREPGEVLKIAAIPFGRIYEYLRTSHGLHDEEIRQVFETLKDQGFVERDKFGFVLPTGRGEGLIRALAGETEPTPSRVPPFPEF